MAATVAIGVPHWLEDLLVARPMAEDAAAAGVPYLFFAGTDIVLGAAAAITFAGAAALITWRKRRGAFAAFVASALLLRAPGFVTSLDVLAGRVPAWAGPTLALRCLDAVAALLFLFVFPSGRFVPRRAAVLWALWAAWVFGTLATPDLDPALSTGQWWAELVVSALALAGLAAQVYRYRSVSTSHERLQTKWVLYGLAVYVGVFALQQLVPVAFSDVRGPGAARFWYRLIGDAANDLAAMLVPITIAIAILRSQLLGIDLIISRTIVYVGVTAILGGVFAGLSSAAQYVLGLVTGHGSDAVSIVIAMIVAVAFTPLKAYVQRQVDRRMRPQTV